MTELDLSQESQSPSEIIDDLKRQNLALIERNAELVEQLRHDPNFPDFLNKKAWSEDLETRVAQADRSFGVFFLDINNFGLLNKELNHVWGDRIIENFGHVLKNAFRRQDDSLGVRKDIPLGDNLEMARFGGDEFGVTVDLSGGGRRADNPHDMMDNMYEYIQHLWLRSLTALPDHIRKVVESEQVGMAIGAAVFDPHDPHDAMTLLQEASESMIDVKAEIKFQLLEQYYADGKAISEDDERIVVDSMYNKNVIVN